MRHLQNGQPFRGATFRTSAAARWICSATSPGVRLVYRGHWVPLRIHPTVTIWLELGDTIGGDLVDDVTVGVDAGEFAVEQDGEQVCVALTALDATIEGAMCY